MASKKFRKIVVNKQTYGWSVAYMGCELRIWKDKRVIHTEDMRTGNMRTTITPAIVRNVIESNNL